MDLSGRSVETPAENLWPMQKRWVIASCLVLGAVATLMSISLIRFNNDIEVMLPRDPEVLRTFHFFRDSPFADNVVLSFELTDDSRPVEDLLRAVDQFVTKVDSQMISRVVTGAGVPDSLGEVQEYVRLAPQILAPHSLEDLDEQLDQTYVKERLQRVYRTLLLPATFLTSGVAQQDPLGLHAKALQDLQKLASVRDYEVQLDRDHFLHKDGRRALVILETTVSVTDSARGQQLVEYLERLEREVPDYVKVDLIAGHLHSISNERVIKRDILVTIAVASVAFLLVFWLFFKDARALLLFLIPGISVVIAIHVCSWITGELSAIVMGMAAVISGIAVDYCIHVYVAMRAGQGRVQALREVTQPLVIAALTTVGVFCAFLLSGVPGYRELALLTITSILLSLAIALCVLPHFLSITSVGTVARLRPSLVRIPAVSDRVTIGIWAAAMLGCLAVLPMVQLRTDIKQYDGTTESILRTEENFQKNWRAKDPAAMLVVEGESFDGVLTRSAELHSEMTAVLDGNEYVTLSEVWPAAPQRRENLKAWNRHWTKGRRAALRERVLAVGGPLGFRADAFESFFERLQLNPTEVQEFERNELLVQLKKRFVLTTPGRYRLVNFFPDHETSVGAVADKSKDWPGTFVVSHAKYARDLSRSISAEALFLSVLIALIVPVLAFLFLRDLELVLIALVPVGTAILAIFGVSTGLGLPVNAASVIALLVVGGLCIDYGIFMVHAHRRELKTDIQLAVQLSAATTMFGAGALLMARHPVLVSFGTTMVVGILAAFLSAIWVVPALCRLVLSKRARRKGTGEGYQTL